MARAAALGILATIVCIVSAACADRSGPEVAERSRQTTVELSPTTTTDAPSATDPATSTDASTTTTTNSPESSTTSPTASPTTDRPYRLFVPEGYTDSVALPLVVNLHGFTSSSAEQERYFALEAAAEERAFIAVHPDGTANPLGLQFWNATDGCCNFTGSVVDDSAYLAAIIEEVSADYVVDRSRVYVIGFSNGGFMAHRMACDHADRVAAVVSLAGATWLDAAQCPASEPVSVLQIHGTADEVIGYDGGSYFGATFPSASATTATWAALNGCDPSPPTSAGTLDLVRGDVADESTIERFAGCPDGGAVELWTMNGAPHVAPLSAMFTDSVIDFLFAHPKR